MDAAVLAAQARWPNVPAVFGWLRLDRRGRWLLRDEPLTHPAMAAFIGRNYACDPEGRWYFQNGPQKVYVRLDYTPWIIRLTDGQLVRHTGQPVGQAQQAWLDEEGSLLIGFGGEVGLVCDRDLPALLERMSGPLSDGPPGGAEALERFLEDPAYPLTLDLPGGPVPVNRILAEKVATTLGFQANPCETPGQPRP